MEEGDEVGIRGPFGRGWPELEGDIALVGGGIGLAPLRPIILSGKGNIQIFYGARTPEDMVFKSEYEEWGRRADVRLTVDRAGEGWKGNVGPVTKIMDIKKGSKVLICGPPVMISFALKKCKELGIPEKDVYVSLERLMKCGVRMCGHCMVGGAYVCSDGPVFRADEMPEDGK